MIRRTGVVLAALALGLAGWGAPQVVRATSEEVSASDGRYLTIAQLRNKYGRDGDRYATIRGLEVRYRDEGEGPAILMVHGSYGRIENFDTLVAHLKDRYRIVRYDVGGMGLTGPISDEVAAKVTPVDVAKGLLDSLGIDRVIFVGFSSGGTLGMYLAAEHPEMVERLILSNVPSDKVTYGHMVQPQSFLDAQKQVARDGGFMARPFWDEYLDYFAGDPARFTPAMREAYYDFARRTPEKHPIAQVARIDEGVVASQRMASITAPAFLIWGGSDALLTTDAMNALETHLAKAQVSKVVMPDVGHYPPIEVPERFARIVDLYLDTILAKKP